MNLLRVRAIAKKEFIQIWRDPRSLALAIAIPMGMLFLFGYALSLDVDRVPTLLWDQDRSQDSRDFLRDFEQSSYFKIMGYASRYSEVVESIETNQALMALILPTDFSKNLQNKKPAPVQLLVDGSDSNTATIATGYVEAVTAKHDQNIAIQTLSKKGQSPTPPLEMRARIWFNPDLKSRNFIIPGLIAVILMVIAALLTSLTVAREWERGTMEQLISTPVKPNELILGKFLPYFLIGFADMMIAVLLGECVFHVPLKGSVALLFLLSGFFLTGALSLGLLISIAAKSQLVASQMAILTTFLPAFLLSGFMYPIANMPSVLQILTHLIPARYFIIIVKGIYLKGIGLKILWMETLFLALFSFITISLTLRKFKKRIA